MSETWKPRAIDVAYNDGYNAVDGRVKWWTRCEKGCGGNFMSLPTLEARLIRAATCGARFPRFSRQRNGGPMTVDVDQVITNARSGACMCGRVGKIIYGPSPFGYGPTCKTCRKLWSRREGKPWRSDEQAREDERREREAITREVNDMPPSVFYVQWQATLEQVWKMQRGHNRSYDATDEFTVSSFGMGTPLGHRYADMRARVRVEHRAFEEARSVL